LLALAIAAVLLATAVPALGSAVEAAHAGAARADLLHTLNRAITHSALTGTEVVVCPGDPAGCRVTADWSAGWVAWADLDGDRERDGNETLLQHQAPLGGRVHLRTTVGRTRLVFQPDGGNAGSNATFTLCDGRGAAQATSLVLANDGRFRAGRPTAAAAQACLRPL